MMNHKNSENLKVARRVTFSSVMKLNILSLVSCMFIFIFLLNRLLATEMLVSGLMKLSEENVTTLFLNQAWGSEIHIFKV
jgi:hypothetical protein